MGQDATIRTEFLLPTHSNEGQQFPEGVFKAATDITQQLFGGCSLDRHSAVIGQWADENGTIFYDRSRKLVVDCKDTEMNKISLSHLKGILQKAFDQKELYTVSYKVKVL